MNLLKTKNGESVGKALTVICAIFIVTNSFYIIGHFFNLFNLDAANQIYAESGINIVLTYPIVIYQIVMSLLMVGAALLLLKGEKLGLFVYLGVQGVGTIYSIISKTFNGSSLYSLVGMILLLVWLVYRKKEIFFK